MNIKTAGGDGEILPGLTIFLTPGHTPGSQTVCVNTARGKVVISGFCCNQANFPAHGHTVCPGVHCDACQAYDAAQRVGAMGDLILPLHELGVASALAG